MKLTVLLIFLFSAHLQAQPKSWGEELKSKIKSLVKKSALKKEHLGVYISYEAFDKDTSLFELNSSKKMIPASLSKLFTAGAVLTKFKNGYKFKTQLVTPSPIEKNILKGDLYLVGGGDPAFVSESLWNLVNKFTRTGILEIEGNIVVDASMFDNVRFDPGRDPSRVDRAYDAPIGAMSFNWNSVNIFSRPNTQRGQGVKVVADPLSQYIELKNRAITGARGSKNTIAITRTKNEKTKKDLITVTGSLPLGHKEIVSYKGISSPSLWSGDNLKAFLNRRGVQVRGVVKVGQAPRSVQVLAEEESQPLERHVSDMMKFSNNYIAEMLTKNLSVLAGHRPGNMTSGLEQIKKFIIRSGVSVNDFTLVNPSGLSRKNKFKPKSIAQVLNHLKSQYRNFPEYLVALPVAGVDGTLKKRFRGSNVKAWIRAKTGRLNGVIGLAGFAKSKRKPLFTFVVLFNGPHSQLNKAMQLSDRIAKLLVNES